MSDAKSVVAVMDYGMGNLRSVANALQKVAPNAEVIVTSEAEQILAADRVIFPGVGAIRDCMAEIRRLGFDEIVTEASRSKPLLAICVGMQALMSHSEENGGVDCIAHFDGEVKHFEPANDANGLALKIPHMGWNKVQHLRGHPLWEGIDCGARFYFVHSYYVQPSDKSLQIGLSDYGVEFAAALSRDNVFATQFHPEKSHTAGLQLLRNFMSWDGQS